VGYQTTATEEEDRTIPEDSIVPATLTEIKLRVVQYNDKQTGEAKSFEQLEWWFEVTSGDYQGRKVKGTTDTKLTTHPKNKFRNWSSVMLNREIADGFPLDTDDLIGLPADVAIGYRPDRKDPSKVYEEVSEVLPASGGQASEPPF
jgi:hypothetical protein